MIMKSSPRLSTLERRVLLGIPMLFPDGDSDDLNIPRADRDEISYAIQHLIGLKLVAASYVEEGSNPYGPRCYCGVVLTTDGEELRRDLERHWLVRWLETEWKWLLSNAIALCALVLSLWNFFHSSLK